MARPEGSAKTGGRKKGTPNKKSINLQDSLESNGLSVVERLTELLPQLAIEKQADVLLSLMPYLHPKRKAIEVVENPNGEDKNIKIEFVESDGNGGIKRDTDVEELAERSQRVLKKITNMMQVDEVYATKILGSLDDYYLKSLGYSRNNQQA